MLEAIGGTLVGVFLVWLFVMAPMYIGLALTWDDSNMLKAWAIGSCALVVMVVVIFGCYFLGTLVVGWI